MNLLNASISNGEGYTHYFLISGQDFILKPIEEIVVFLEKHKNENFIDCSTVDVFEKRNDIFFPKLIIGRKKMAKSFEKYSNI